MWPSIKVMKRDLSEAQSDIPDDADDDTVVIEWCAFKNIFPPLDVARRYFGRA